MNREETSNNNFDEDNTDVDFTTNRDLEIGWAAITRPIEDTISDVKIHEM